MAPRLHYVPQSWSPQIELAYEPGTLVLQQTENYVLAEDGSAAMAEAAFKAARTTLVQGRPLSLDVTLLFCGVAVCLFLSAGCIYKWRKQLNQLQRNLLKEKWL